MASAGPLTSLTIGGLGLLVQQLVTDNIDRVPSLQPVEAVAGYLGFINIAVAIFNLVPGFPLDGGRVLRSIIWGLRGDRVVATRIAARGGQLVAGLMVVYAASRVLNGEATGGLWLGLIAYFLYGAASQALQQERVTAAVGSVRVAQLMTTDFRSAPAWHPDRAADPRHRPAEQPPGDPGRRARQAGRPCHDRRPAQSRAGPVGDDAGGCRDDPGLRASDCGAGR
jgi:hypothetical protein